MAAVGITVGVLALFFIWSSPLVFYFCNNPNSRVHQSGLLNDPPHRVVTSTLCSRREYTLTGTRNVYRMEKGLH